MDRTLYFDLYNYLLFVSGLGNGELQEISALLNLLQQTTVMRMRIVFVLMVVVFSYFLKSAEAQSKNLQKKNSKALKIITRQMHPLDKTFLNEHKCKANITEQRIETGFARWTVVFIKCRNIDAVIPAVLCDKRCINPATCKKMPGRKYRPMAIMTEIPVKDRNDMTTYLKVPTSCQCTAKKPKCKKASGNRRTKSSRRKH